MSLIYLYDSRALIETYSHCIPTDCFYYSQGSWDPPGFAQSWSEHQQGAFIDSVLTPTSISFRGEAIGTTDHRGDFTFNHSITPQFWMEVGITTDSPYTLVSDGVTSSGTLHQGESLVLSAGRALDFTLVPEVNVAMLVAVGLATIWAIYRSKK